ncbi:disease resistance protein RUN1-like [Quercus robur]|uniref:disease resistance protein RUN1-like n=1 Tax=Quercus robur TaxID=38942 RepID=UPI002163FA7E|nr:disease resistance protein RUN1-like [Quercus robur]XP_050244578.1 disease resistance protein RUN1-like [Quercus robur]XP_050244579.1 disease resistance protein RUN1-like [Quercus robur]XP_050244580.1 disease resistance protein RUN1-like [Quercus robur]XP_050244581.1 disease resistance protein RUN1-like [Quercus robur]XP_050244582.1 disease resistance protein RUN1-like [Quercus robur]XP_050244583.1 disease resistance protein RUN1-like [Quercus robur]XP_050244584.1 disease resistance prote
MLMAFPTREELTFFSSSTCQWSHDIFLSFRGVDTRYGFTGNLYNALCNYGLNTFFDINLERGEEISKELLKTIELSMISIVVLSENYASSSWCLDELVKILECKNTGRIRKVYPIFYKVTPSEVRNNEGKFGIALDNHEKKFKDNMEKVKRWKEALTEVTKLAGYEYKNGEYEFEFIQRIIEEISIIKSIHIKLPIAKYPVEVDSQAKAIESLLDVESNGVFMVGIYGLGGVGKTTISKAVYNRINDRFEGSCFLENVRENSKTDAGIIQLQETLLSKILRSRFVKVSSVLEGITMIKERFCNKKVLLILDDVDQSKEIEKLLGYCNWLASGSRVIITTRDRNVLPNLGRDPQIRTYEVQKMNPRDARVLFNMHAFGNNNPKQGYSNLVEQIMSYVDGLPLALVIMGSDLYGKSIDHWTCAIEKYKKIPHGEIINKLKISYDGLEKGERDIFLDIACFFKGFKMDEVVNILDACKLSSSLGINKLIEKCLITVDIWGILRMHDLLQQMGREIIEQESEELENRSRIWCYEDAYKLLTENMGSNKIRGIMWNSPIPRLVKLQANAFKNMRNLKFLLVENVRISKALKYLPNELRLLQWSKYDFPLPLKFCPHNLVVLNMPNSRIRWEKVLKQGRAFEALKNVNLDGCKFITKLPSLLCAPNLKNLDMRGCVNLIEVHESFGYLDKLERWDLTNCRNLKILPSLLVLRSLKYFRLTYCRRLEKFPAICAPNLEILAISHCKNLIEVHESVGDLDKLKSWYLESCIKLEILPSRLQLRSLEILDLKNCGRLEKFPDIHPEMKYLQNLYMTNTVIREWPSSFTHLTKGLFELVLYNNENLWNILHSRNKLQLLEEIDIPTANSFDGFLSLESLWLDSWDGVITELDFQYFPLLSHLYILDSNFISIPQSISGLARLQYISIKNCKQLREIPMLPQSVKEAHVRKCPSLDPQSSSRLLIQVGEVLGIFPNYQVWRVHEGARSNISMDPFHDSESESESKHDYEVVYYLTLPVTEIPKRGTYAQHL